MNIICEFLVRHDYQFCVTAQSVVIKIHDNRGGFDLVECYTFQEVKQAIGY